jgi:hypothetical protein
LFTKVITLKRKFLAAKENVADGVNEIAKESGRTVFSIVNEALSAFITAKEAGRSLPSIIEEGKNAQIARNAGMILVPEASYDSLLESCSITPRIYDGWRTAGTVFGKYLYVNEIHEDTKSVETAIKAVIGGNPDITFSEERLICISPRFGEKQTEAVAAFLEGLLRSLNLTVTAKEISKGIIIITSKQEGE